MQPVISGRLRTIEVPHHSETNANYAPRHLKPTLNQLICEIITNIEYRRDLILSLNSVILKHPSIHPNILSFHLQHRLGLLRINDEMVITVRAVLITFIPVLSFFAEAFLAFLAREGHFGALEEDMLLRFGVALRAVEPFFACVG